MSDKVEVKNDCDFVITRRANGSLRVDNVCSPDSLVQQCFKDSADINKIMAKWLKAGNAGLPQIDLMAKRVFRDLSQEDDFERKMNVVADAQSAFETLPAALRARFAHDVMNVVNFVADPANEAEAIKLGLMDVIGEATLSVPTVESGAEKSEQVST